VAIVGPPNAGKSSLFNTLVGRDAAIVADVAGTTRDIIEASLDIGGYRVLLADTAGMRATESAVEAEGVRRARAWADGAARRIWVFDGSSEDDAWREDLGLWRRGDLFVLNKSDLPQTVQVKRAVAEAGRRGLVALSVSVRERVLGGLRDWISRDVVEAMSGADFPAITRRRHAVALASAAAAVRRAILGLAQPELSCEDLRLASRALASVTGAIAADDVLGEVFATFCIGK
jgi:tRNA modification GTPase